MKAVGGDGGRRADGTVERTEGREFRVEGAEAKVSLHMWKRALVSYSSLFLFSRELMI